MKMFFYYAKTADNSLLIACYHENLQALASTIVLARKNGLNRSDFSSRIEMLEKPYDLSDIKNKFLSVLKVIAAEKAPYSSIKFTGDLNLCCSNKRDLALFLFDSTLKDFFRKKPVHVTLESSEAIFVEAAIRHAHAQGMTDAVIQLKQISKTGSRCEIFPNSKPVQKKNALAHPETDKKQLANSPISIRANQKLRNSLSKNSFFEQEDSSLSGSSACSSPEVPRCC